MQHLKNAQRIAKLLDSQFSILGFKFGLEPLIGLLPGLGDTITLFLSLYLFYVALQLKIPRTALIQMLFNIGFDFLVGSVPVVGDLADFFYKANTKNLQILERYAKPEEGKIIH